MRSHVYIIALFCLYEGGFVFCYCFLGSKLSQLQDLYLPHIFFPFFATTTDAFKLFDFIFNHCYGCFQACNQTFSEIVHALHAFIICSFCSGEGEVSGSFQTAPYAVAVQSVTEAKRTSPSTLLLDTQVVAISLTVLALRTGCSISISGRNPFTTSTRQI